MGVIQVWGKRVTEKGLTTCMSPPCSLLIQKMSSHPSEMLGGVPLLLLLSRICGSTMLV